MAGGMSKAKAKWQKEQELKVSASPEVSKENRKVGDRSRESDVEDGTVEKRRSGERGRAFGFELGQWS